VVKPSTSEQHPTVTTAYDSSFLVPALYDSTKPQRNTLQQQAAASKAAAAALREDVSASLVLLEAHNAREVAQLEQRAVDLAIHRVA
jgi:hypothetical protein